MATQVSGATMPDTLEWFEVNVKDGDGNHMIFRVRASVLVSKIGEAWAVRFGIAPNGPGRKSYKLSFEGTRPAADATVGDLLKDNEYNQPLTLWFQKCQCGC
ncbi:hypothetical protein FA09DRAFT_162798 [Tilletiopsis washingtonensis]|uniref:Rad60/SUMO-like domain-containing protein n=1 Tax=Tilletiopsis washingtonensis TaxID=58919 RepID=A0A316Z0S1_9BASI|nr:hypothetical protein FA09DRAFT_162798 [Tilletiopsis washingtonensis]PWN94906.1 hypothetical protein FA09DRAFT_162798 [Tilletiopsis washingtonensis]